MNRHGRIPGSEDHRPESRELGDLADSVWDHPETAFTEFVSAGLLADYLEKEGFAVTRGVADIPTAFTARYGSGRPVIGLLGEFDALSGLSQKAGVAEPCPLEPGGNGHGCGHNLLGVGALAAALAVKQYLQRTGAARHRPLLWLSRRGRGQRQGFHGPQRHFRAAGLCPQLAPGRGHPCDAERLFGQYPGAVHL